MNRLPDVLEIEDVKLPMVLERSNRKSLTIQITREEQLLIKAPDRMDEREIWRFLQQKRFWIYKQAKRVQEENKVKVYRSEEEIYWLKQRARVLLTTKTENYAKLIGVTFGRIRIGDQKTRWGSCSSRGTISYNWHLILMPERIMNYVVVHELCHLVEMNHSKRFWEMVEDVLPNYAECRYWLKKYGDCYL